MSVNDHAAPHTQPAAQWIYRGLWKWLVKWMRVPAEPPTLPAHVGQFHRSFQPSPGYLKYLKFGFWLGLLCFDGFLFVIWLILLIKAPRWGVMLTAPFWIVMIVPDIVVYIVLHLRYDTMWYVMTDRSLRIRRGIWTIHETTITFENVQHVRVKQGPLQRWFGIADVEVQTAGGGMPVPNQNGGGVASGHIGMIEGVSNAKEIRDLILSQLRLSRTAGLGDESRPPAANVNLIINSQPRGSVGERHLIVLREIRELVNG